MRTLTIIALGLALLFVFVGCEEADPVETDEVEEVDEVDNDVDVDEDVEVTEPDEIGALELNDENFAKFYVEWWEVDIDEEDALLAKYGWTEEEVWDFEDGIFEDEERATKVYEMILALDEEAAEMFEWEMEEL